VAYATPHPTDTLLTESLNNPDHGGMHQGDSTSRACAFLVRRLHVDLMRLPSACCPRAL
jgi:hypothetical protein